MGTIEKHPAMNPDEVVEMELAYVQPIMDAEQAANELSMDEALEDWMKLFQLHQVFSSYKLALKVKDQVEDDAHLMILVIEESDAGKVLRASGSVGRERDLLCYQMLKALSKVGVTMEKAWLYDSANMQAKTRVYLKRENGEDIVLEVQATDALCMSLLTETPFYVSKRYMKEPYKPTEYSRTHMTNMDMVRLRSMPMFMLQQELDQAIRKEAYEYAAVVKIVMDEKKQNGGNTK